MIGSVVDARYELLERTGEGTFFSVFRGRDRVVNRTVAVKILFSRYAGNVEFSARLRNELRAASVLNHPSIARIYEAGDHSGVVYAATEYVRGTTLKERIRHSAPLPLGESIDLAIHLAEALEYAHRSGFVHGDLTAHNVLVSPEMDAKITDFGVSKAAVGSALVQSNALLRGVHYLAPEVAQGQDATPASDTYALGIILFEMLTGSLPYNGDTPLAVALKHAQEPIPSPRTLNPGVPRAIEGIIMKALAKDPAERYASASAMLLDLRRAQECLRLGRSLAWSPRDPGSQPGNAVDAVDTVLPKSPRRDFWRIASVSLSLLVTILLVGFVIFFFTGFGIPKDVTVPDLVGKPRTEAEAALQELGLKMKVIEEQNNDKYPAEQIIYTIPESGRQIKAGREVRVAVSRGPEMTAVPNLQHTTVSEARKLIEQVGLKMGKIQHDYDDVIPRGQVSAQEPAPDQQAPKGSEVGITLSRGPDASLNPDVFRSDESTNPQQPQPAQRPAQPAKPAPPQQWDVTVEVPAGDKDQPQMVRILVVQNGQEKEAYKAEHQPGDKFSTAVESTGPATIQVYINDQLIREEQVGTSE